MNSLINNNEVGKAQIAKNEATHNQQVLLSALFKPLTDFILFVSNNSKIFP